MCFFLDTYSDFLNSTIYAIIFALVFKCLVPKQEKIEK